MLLNLFSTSELILFAVFGFIVVIFLVVDLGLLNKTAQKVTQKSALNQSIFWVIVSLLFGILIYLSGEGEEVTMEYFSAYFTEKALSMDNIFVILLILKYFKVEEEHYHRILYWGILGAVVFRAFFIFVGAFLIGEFHWILYIFGIFLIYSGVKIFNDQEEMEVEPEKNIFVRFSRRFLRITKEHMGGKFWVKRQGKVYFTTLFLVVILIESTDLIFAVDSIPAAFAITQNEFVIYTSNIFAILGLRAMFFLLANILNKFYLLQKGLSIILIFVGLKMLLEIIHVYVPIGLSFAVIIATLFGSIVLSLLFKKPPAAEFIETERRPEFAPSKETQVS